MNYKTYAEAKIANPDYEIVTTGKKWSGCDDVFGYFEKRMKEHQLGDDAWVICNPAEYCSSIKEFLEAGFKFSIGDLFLGEDGAVHDVGEIYPQTNKCEDSDDKRYILSAVALNGGCKIPAKVEQWTIYNNTMPLCELTGEQAAALFNAWRGGEVVENVHCESTCLKTGVTTYEWSYPQVLNWGEYIIYRIKPKSERELFIDKSVGLMTSETERTMEQMFGAQFDAGARYKDQTQHFGENI